MHTMFAFLSFVFLCILPLTTALYSTGSQVLQVTAQTYPLLISSSNSTSLLEFYAPWCGHCRNLASAYEKTANSLKGLATVAAIDCDDDSNKQFCGSMGVKGFPTLKIVKPSSKKGRSEKIEDYNGQRTSSSMTNAVIERMVDRTTRVKDAKWTASGADNLKALIVTEKGASPPALVKALSTDFLHLIDFGWAKLTDKEVLEAYGIKSAPAVIMFPGSNERVPYHGSMKKDALLEFFSRWATPHMDVKTRSQQLEQAKKSKKVSKSKSETKEPKPKPASESFRDAAEESPRPNVVTEDTPPPVQLPISKPEKLTELVTEEALQKSCLSLKSGTCVLAMLPPLHVTDEGAEASRPEESAVLDTLAQIAHKYAQRRSKIFPFYVVTDTNRAGNALSRQLGLENRGNDVQLLAINSKRAWWSPYPSDDTGRDSLESWIDEIRLGDVTKENLPEALLTEIRDHANNVQPQDSKPVDQHGEL